MTRWIGVLALGVWTAQSPLISVQEALRWPNPEPLARIPYGDDPLQFGDLRLPPGDGPHPVVVVIHGGCWRSDFNLDYIGAFSDALTRSGVATWTLEYRRVGDPGGGWPGTLQDVASGVDHLRSVARDHPLDLDRVIIRFAGDSGDGMQLTGNRFTDASALFGNDLATLPEFPAEIRAPAGTLAGVSAFQVHISDHEITTPGDAPNGEPSDSPQIAMGSPLAPKCALTRHWIRPSWTATSWSPSAAEARGAGKHTPTTSTVKDAVVR